MDGGLSAADLSATTSAIAVLTNGHVNGTPPDAEDSAHASLPSSSSPQLSVVLTLRLLMQGKEVGSIIGKRGDHIKLIRDRSNAKINISDGSCPERIVSITGIIPTINAAFQMIAQKFEEDMQTIPATAAVPRPPITMRLIIPATQCGSIIGKGGAKIKEIREKTGASIQVASEMLPNSTERAVTISGSSDALVECMRQICVILQEAPPKGATLPFRPKPTYNPMLIASSAAAAAAAQQQSQQLLNYLSQQHQQQQIQQQQQLQTTNPVFSGVLSYGQPAYVGAGLDLQNVLLSNMAQTNGANGVSALQLQQQYAAAAAALSSDDLHGATLMTLDPRLVPATTAATMSSGTASWPTAELMAQLGGGSAALIGAPIQQQHSAVGKIVGTDGLQFAAKSNAITVTGRHQQNVTSAVTHRFAPY